MRFSRVLIAGLLILLSMASHAHTVVQAFRPTLPPCEVALLEKNPLMASAAPLLRTFDQLIERNPNNTVKQMIDRLLGSRGSFIEQARKLSRETQNPTLRAMIDENIDRLKFTDKSKIILADMVKQCGDEKLPKLPLSSNALPIWAPRLEILRRVTLSKQEFGLIGEIVVAAHLPGVVSVNLGPLDLFSQREQMQLFNQLNREDRQWVQGLSHHEIDVLFNDGEAIGEIKIAKKSIGRTSEMYQSISKQAQRLARLIQIFADHGIQKSGYFIILGSEPTPAVTELLNGYGLNIISLPHKFK